VSAAGEVRIGEVLRAWWPLAASWVLMGAELPVISLHRQIASALHLIVHIDRLPTGKRVVSQVSEVNGIDPANGEVIVTDIFNRRNGKSLEPTGYLPSFLEHLVAKQLLDARFLYGTPSSP